MCGGGCYAVFYRLRALLSIDTLRNWHDIVCLDADEDMINALITCTCAKMFWREAREWLHIKLPELHTVTLSRGILVT